MLGFGACPAHFQALQNLLYQARLEVTAMLCSSRGNSEAAEEVGIIASANVEASWLGKM
jgi:hypothetical protein